MKKSTKIALLLVICFFAQNGFTQKVNIAIPGKSPEREITWQDWNEYMDWGKNNLTPKEFQKTLPDTNAVMKFYEIPRSTVDFKDEKIQSQPVIGVSWKQAKQYAEWISVELNNKKKSR